MTKPNIERIRLWEQALRDPDLLQGSGRLASWDDARDKWAQCCLDVACQVAKHNGLELKEHIYPDAIRGYAIRGYVDRCDCSSCATTVQTGILPSAVRDWYGFGSQDPELVDVDNPVFQVRRNATTLNDSKKYTFEQIADCVAATFLSPSEA